mgnify:CR=1 FL=1
MNRVLLCIMDGWGISKGSEKYDATKLAEPVNVPRLIKEEVSTNIHADGMYVGLPEGQMGNSEVGHLNLGAGRIVYQDLSKINKKKRYCIIKRQKASHLAYSITILQKRLLSVILAVTFLFVF